MDSTTSLNEEYRAIIDELDGDYESRLFAARYMASSTAISHGEVIKSSFFPRLFNHSDHDRFTKAASTLYGIFAKVTAHYLSDPSYRKLFGFEERLERLIRLPNPYDSLLPVCRIDMFYNDETGDFAYCEFNTDGSSGMNENLEISRAIGDSASMRRFASQHQVEGCELFESWVDCFLTIYSSCEGAVASPVIGICDLLENATMEEFVEYERRFKQRGLDCSIVDLRDLRFDNGVLSDVRGKCYDVIWRRVIFKDVIDHWDEAQALIQAVESQSVVLIGGFSSTIIHDKRVFLMLHRPETLAFLSPDERAYIAAHIPYTAYLRSDEVDMDAIKADKDAWIIKPTDDNDSSDVFAGNSETHKDWEALIDRFVDDRSGRPFLVQRFIPAYQSLIMEPDELNDENELVDPHPRWAYYNNMNGLYLYDGKLVGIFSRLGPNKLICGRASGLTAATYWVDCNAH